MVKSTEKTTFIVFIVAIVAVSVGLTIGLVLHYTLYQEPHPMPRKTAVGNCLPNTSPATKADCDKRGCMWQPTTDGSPFCTFPSQYGYLLTGEVDSTEFGQQATLTRVNNQPTIFGNDVIKLVVNVTYQNEHRLRIKISDAEKDRYEVPREAVDISEPNVAPPNATRLYDVVWITEPHFGLQVVRRSTQTVIFDTTTSGFVFSDQYIQLTTVLPSDNVYGFGEHVHERFRHDMNWKSWTIFARDQPPGGNWNLYGSQTLYMNLDDDNNAHGVFLLNSNAMTVVLQPKPYPAITYHIIGGILDFYIFLGPTPENIVQQYTEAVGRPAMPPYWALGFQLSRYDYNNLTHVRAVVDRNREAGIPQDVQYGDIDYMESKLDFTYDKQLYNGLPQFVEDLHARGQKYVVILDHALGCNETFLAEALHGPYVPYEDGKNRSVFIREPRNTMEYLQGSVWPGLSVYPDFTLGQNVSDWWTYWCRHLRDSSNGGENINYDGLWIDMNEPANFEHGSVTGCSNSSYNYPPYLPKSSNAEDGAHIFDKTICMDAQQNWGLHYNVHNLYGHSMAMTTYNSLRSINPNLRPFLLLRSNFAGTQKYGAHWLGDNASQWPHLAWSIVGMLEFSLFGFSNTGADICGYFDNVTEQMCQRWMQLGAFYPFARNHNGAGYRDQDPAAFSADMIRSSRDILMTRYKLLPFLYTLLHEAHVYGNTVVRPLLHEFTSDKSTWSIDRQFLWGPSLMIAPVLEQDATIVNVYFPAGRWYDYYGGAVFESTGVYRDLSTPLDKIQLHIRGGYIIPWQTPDNTTEFSRRNPFGLIVALGSPPSYQAQGNLYWDDGNSHESFEKSQYLLVNFKASGSGIEIEVVQNSTYAGASSLEFTTIDIWGLERRITNVNINGIAVQPANIEYYDATKNTRLTNVQLSITANATIAWQIES